jgi:serine protease Do
MNTRTRTIASFFSIAMAAMLLGAVVTTQVRTQTALARPVPETFSDLAEKLLPAVVNISTTQVLKQESMQNVPEIPQFPPGSPFEEFFRDFMERHLHPEIPRKATSLGSGFIIDPSGIVVTNNHVIADADEITVILHDNTALKAEIIGRDPKVDVALLRVKSDKPLPSVKMGDSDTARVGDWVMAIGNPFGLGGSVTVGIVSPTTGTSTSAPMTTSSRPTPRSTAATPAGPSSTCPAK